MGREKKQVEEEAPAGAPEWMVTFSDCMTLLLTFFVLLLSFASFDVREFKQVSSSFADALNFIGNVQKRETDSVIEPLDFMHSQDLDKGSEARTDRFGKENGVKREADLDDFQKQRVFLIPSTQLFLGKGILLSPEGRKILSLLVTYLQEDPHRVVISENPYQPNGPAESFGMERAWTIMTYFTRTGGLDETLFSLSEGGTITQVPPEVRPGPNDRRAEIVLLERSVYP